MVTIKGTGLNTQTFDWADFGDPGQASSQDTDWVFQTGTELQIAAPPEASTVDIQGIPFSVKTLAGQSNAITAQFTGTPTVSSVVNTQNAQDDQRVAAGPGHRAEPRWRSTDRDSPTS